MRSHHHIKVKFAVVIFLLYFGQILGGTLHFLSAEHGVITAQGALGHGHGCDHSEAVGVSAEPPREDLPLCHYLSILLRVYVGLEKPALPQAGAPGYATFAVSPPCRRCPSLRVDLLDAAPKHSPPPVG